MFNLTLDTSTNLIVLALSFKSTLVDSRQIPHQNKLSCSLIPSLEEMLQKNKISMKEISTLFVGIGPGSYTGTRIAVATMQALSIACNIPLGSFYSPLAFLPQNLPEGPFAFLIEAKSAKNFLLLGHIQSGAIRQDLSHLFVSKEDLSLHITPKTPLISFEQDPEITAHFSLFQAAANCAALVSYLDKLPQTSTPPRILYLHQP
jgi:tRNA threonylcarbamoyladenosine biosynthesis protein TsaB